METALRARLLAAAPVAAMVAKRVDWTVRPQAKPLPAVTLQIVADRRDQHMAGLAKFRPTRVQVDCWGTTRADVVALREAVITALLPAVTRDGVEFLRAFVNTVVDRGENTDTGFMHRDMIDMTIWHDG